MTAGKTAHFYTILLLIMETISFTENWNGKLLLDVFGTIREHCPVKYEVGKQFGISLKGKVLGIVEVVAIRHFKHNQIRDAGAFLDIGRNAHYLATFLNKMYGNKGTISPDHQFDHIILKWMHRDMAIQQTVLKSWWEEKQQLTMDSFWAIQNANNSIS